MGFMDRYEQWEAGRSLNHAAQAFPTSVLRRIEEILPSTMQRTAETGSGKSTILFSNLSHRHTVFTLDDTSQSGSSVAFFRECPLTKAETLEVVLGPTQRTLKMYPHSDQYDCVLIDGPHGWPFPEFEYLMLYPHIKKGGYLLLDDCCIPTIGRMADILVEDEMWHLVEVVGLNTAVFRRLPATTLDPEGDGWWTQIYNRRRVSSRRDIWLGDSEPRDTISGMGLDKMLHDEVVKPSEREDSRAGIKGLVKSLLLPFGYAVSRADRFSDLIRSKKRLIEMTEVDSTDSPLCLCGGVLASFFQSGKPAKRGEVQARVCNRCCYVCFPPPTEAELTNFYTNDFGSGSAEYYTYETDHEPGRVAYLAGIALDLAKTFHPGREDLTILELGCAFGGVVAELRRLKYSAYGLDLNTRAITDGRAKGNSFLYDLSPDKFHDVTGVKADVIYSYHMLEHVRDLRPYLESVGSVLNEGGIAMFRVPNGAYLRAWLCGFETWEWFAFPEHLHMLTAVSAAGFVRSCGFELVALKSNACGESPASVAAWLPNAAEKGPSVIDLLERKGCLMELEFVLRKPGGQPPADLAYRIARAANFATHAAECEDSIKRSVTGFVRSVLG
jgi:SAM-dependent methyltransferase